MTTPHVFGDASPAIVPFAPNEDRDDFALSEHKDKTVIVDVIGVEKIKTNSYGEKPALRCSRIVVLGAKPKVYTDVLIFAAAVVKDFAGLAGRVGVVAKVGNYESRYGTTGWKFDAPTEDGIEEATKFLASES